MTERDSAHGGDGTDAAAIVARARQETASFVAWLEDRVVPVASASYPLELASWQRELEQIRGLVDRPAQVRIALIGTTGAGKSSFLNAVLGQEVLPIGVMEPCTAFVTAVTVSQDSKYHATVEFCSRDEWERDLAALLSSLQSGEEEQGGGGAEERRIREAARKRVEAVFGLAAGELTAAMVLDGLTVPEEVERIWGDGGQEAKHFEDAKDLLQYLRDLVRGSSRVWPLVTRVSLSGPYPWLSGGIELVDLPGLNDPNAARVDVTREYLRTSPFVWLVFSMVRGLTADVKRVLEEEKLLRLLVMSGSLGALSLVGTKADDVDVNIAPQLGLSEDCEQSVLIAAYREQTKTRVRQQLEEMIRDLGTGSEDTATLESMAAMAREVRVHATSANAYMKLEGIGRLRRDFGIEQSDETGIPGVHQHLAQIGKEAGAAFSAQAARLRLMRLKEEIAFFFRAQAQRPSEATGAVRSRIQAQHEAFQRSIDATQAEAHAKLGAYRERFLEELVPLLEASVQGVGRVTREWEGIQWATLRAIVNRNGMFRSPTTGRSFDLNSDLADPLLTRLPVSWERYFTQDLDRVTDAFVVRLTEAGRGFCREVTLVVEMAFGRNVDSMSDQLRWFQDKLASLAAESTSRVRAAVRERRSDLAARMPMVARSRMDPAYQASRDEAGPGMKRRILERLQPTAAESAQPIFSTIQADLVEGLADLEAMVSGMFRHLVQAAAEQARIVAHNANVDVDEAAHDPVLKRLLESMPPLAIPESQGSQ